MIEVIFFLHLFLFHGVNATPMPTSDAVQESCAVIANGMVSLFIITDTKPECDVGLTNPGLYIKLEYRQVHVSNSYTEEEEDWRNLGVASILTHNVIVNFNFNFTYCNTNNPLVQFRLIQWEHGGGDCNCWAINEWNVNIQNRPTQINENRQCSVSGSRDYVVGRYGFCSGSASVPRGFLSHVINLRSGESAEISCPARLSHIIKHVGLPFKQNCSNSNKKITISFQLEFPDNDCDKPESMDKGVELALGNWDNDGYWIPLVYFIEGSVSLSMVQPRISMGNFNSNGTFLGLRGFDVPVWRVTGAINLSLEICDDAYLNHDSIKFRWLETSKHPTSKRPPVDVWLLDDVEINFESNGFSSILLRDNFDNQVLNSTFWNQEIRNGNLSNNVCHSGGANGNYLAFSKITPRLNSGKDHNVVSRLVTTAFLNLIMNEVTTLTTEVITTETITEETTTEFIPTTTEETTTEFTTEEPTTIPTTTEEPTTIPTTTEETTTKFIYTTTEEPTTISTTTEKPTTTPTTTEEPTTEFIPTITEEPTTEFISTTTEEPTTEAPVDPYIIKDLETTVNKANDEINNDPKLKEILNADPEEAIVALNDLTSSGVVTNKAAAVLLMSEVLNRTNQNVQSESEFIETFMSVGNNIISQSQFEEGDSGVLGSTVLSTMDRFAFDVFEDEGSRTVGSITLQAVRKSPGEDDSLLTILDSDKLKPQKDKRSVSLHIPSQLLRMFKNYSDDGTGRLRLTSFIFEDVGLFPNTMPDRNNTELASGIVSSAVQCGKDKCPTDNLELDTPIRISIQHSDEVKERLMNDNSSEVACVFWEFLSGVNSENEKTFSAGQWSDRGCVRNKNLSNPSITVCECNHLTHFAILLSAAPLKLSEPVTLSLEILSYIGVSVSIIAMALTILSFIIQKSVFNMRNFIHVNLCISLGIAQIIFVAGIDKSASDHVPIHCQVIAVFLHYFFLVAFMWMLMEGVVLYIILVKVFVTNTSKKYMIGFTVASYGIPVLYLVLTLSLGFGLPRNNYGYNSACFLNPETKFIWAFIAPVIVILVINLGFFIMAATIMLCHKRKRTGHINAKNAKNWLKSLIPLTLIMGLTWIFGVLIVEVPGLIVLAYIYTFMVAFQGTFIFIIFVCLSKSVRSTYLKLFKTCIKKSDTLSKLFPFSESTTTAGMTTESMSTFMHRRSTYNSRKPSRDTDLNVEEVDFEKPSVSQLQNSNMVLEIFQLLNIAEHNKNKS